MSPSEVLYLHRMIGAMLHRAGVLFGETRKANDPADARRRLAVTADALREALKAIERLQ